MLKKILILVGISAAVGLLSRNIGLNSHQALSISILIVSILSTLFFWRFRLSFAFLGVSILLLTRTIDLEHIAQYVSIEVIFFLIGMMVLIQLLKNAGFFAWIVALILQIKHLTAFKFIVSISVISALLACVVDEVTSIIFIVGAVFEICDYFEVDVVPFLIISVSATNIGSSGTVLGNPIGILIATKSGLTFEDFIIKAFPIMLVCMLALIIIVKFWYREAIAELDRKIKEYGANEMLIKLISVPPDKELKKSLFIFGLTILLIVLHYRLELFLKIAPNTILLTAPLISSACVMIWKWEKARDFIEKGVEWWTLLFFMFLFAQTGALKYTGATDVLARYVVNFAGNRIDFLTGLFLWISTIGSSILDNVVLVAAFIPVVQSLQGLSGGSQQLWWALLFGGCLGGNITLVGSTANIVALGILEKEKKIHIGFFRWFGIGLTVGVVTTAIAWGMLLVFY